MSSEPTSSDSARDDRVLNPEEQRERLQGFVSEAKQLQDLLQTYQQQQRSLEADVAAFVVQEIKEQNVMKELNEEILRRECGALKNVDYVRFAQKHKEGSIQFEQTAPTQRMRDCNSDAATPSGQRGSLAHTVLAGLKASDSHVAPWCPDGVADLSRYGDLKEVLLGWRAATSSTLDEVAALAEDAFTSLNKDDDSQHHRRDTLCCFANGILCVPGDVLDHDGAPEASLARAVASCTSPTPTTSAAELATRFADWLHDTCAFSAQTFVPAVQAAIATEADAQSGMFTRGLAGDTHDTLVLVDPARLHHTELFRAIVLRGEVAAVEHVGASVDVLPTLAMSAVASQRQQLRTCAQERVIATATMLYRELVRCCGADVPLLSSPGNVVLTFAVGPEACEVSTTIENATHACGVLIDVCRLTPTLPFRWHLTWGEVCSLGQMRRESAGADAVNVVFKCGNVQAACLEPFDAVSSAYYPTLNTCVTVSPGAAVAALPTDTASSHRTDGNDHNARALSYARGAAASAVALTAAAAVVRLWSRKL